MNSDPDEMVGKGVTVYLQMYTATGNPGLAL